ncbi:amino acid ABC transporter permease [Paucibacter sp. KBW04]|uniref:branched-chain amino acid ABC transporter permease n=1 Tax=Paucibacter sp. KBW04 TaxID=2153361 RepID=UPI000F570127|nr:branched-chain amino acid ABC transporter permease [Paucibacter sp. KBW04]RQO63529.1 amino acid ABC transporter permease [Paucibacter sp. KBW04]
MSTDLSFIALSALNLSCIYALLALGVSIVFASLGLVNMAHGFSFATAGYGAWLVASYLSSNPWLVMAGGLAVGALCGLLICAIAFIPLHEKPNFVMRGMVATLAINLLGIQGLQTAFGPSARSLPPLFGAGAWGGIPADKAGTIACALLLMGLTLLWMTRSRMGLQVRAMMQNPEGAALVGIGVRRTALLVMAVTGGLAGMAAVLLSQTYFVSPYAGTTPLVKGLIVALAGGLGSVPGAVAAAVLVGVIEALTGALLGGQYVLITQFLFIIAVLLLRPRGLGGLLDHTRE